MKKTAIFYGSSTGNTETAAKQIAEKLDADVFDVDSNPADKLAAYENIVFGTSTWGIGDLQDDWESFISEVEKANLDGKNIAIFGFGDGMTYPDSFVDGIGTIYNAIKDKGCKIVGSVGVDSYDYDSSVAEVDGKFIGLPLDEENQSDLTESRIEDWTSRLKEEFV